VWRPEWTDHPNGVTGIDSMTVVVRSTGAAQAGWKKFLGRDAVTEIGGQEFSVKVGPTELRFLTEAAAGDALPELRRRKWRPPFVAGMALSVTDPAETVRALEAGGIGYTRKDDQTVAVTGSQANGVSLEFCAL
ncbi:MAG: hypothetical protein OXH64_02100, partial [Rhodospirillaceae bacterium]|nr:hypothetical protein [Rhodospirillaceae bacterium]